MQNCTGGLSTRREYAYQIGPLDYQVRISQCNRHGFGACAQVQRVHRINRCARRRCTKYVLEFGRNNEGTRVRLQLLSSLEHVHRHATFGKQLSSKKSGARSADYYNGIVVNGYVLHGRREEKMGKLPHLPTTCRLSTRYSLSFVLGWQHRLNRQPLTAHSGAGPRTNSGYVRVTAVSNEVLWRS